MDGDAGETVLKNVAKVQVGDEMVDCEGDVELEVDGEDVGGATVEGEEDVKV